MDFASSDGGGGDGGGVGNDRTGEEFSVPKVPSSFFFLCFLLLFYFFVQSTCCSREFRDKYKIISPTMTKIKMIKSSDYLFFSYIAV